MDDQAPELLAWLSSPEAYPRRPSVGVHETHASRVFLAGDRAYKVKKPVALPFLDYSTLAQRRRACRDEVSVNQELAPDLYLGTKAIVRTTAGLRFARDGAEHAVEYAVEMRRFDERDTLAGLIEARGMRRKHIAEVARVLARFHARARVIAGSTAERALGAWRRNIDELAELERPAAWRLDALAGFADAFLAERREELERRARDGLIRDGHGDLRCEHVLVRPRIRVIDRIEFDPSLRQIDVAADLAFLAMDLEALEQRWAAKELVSAYAEEGMDPGSGVLRSFYGAHWALVRAKVALLAARERASGVAADGGRARAEAERLAALSDRLCWRARGPLVIVVCGPPASGKSVLAGELARRAEIDVVSSDLVRKRLAHIAPSARARAEHYSEQFTRATYEQITREAVEMLGRGRGVIVDATCAKRANRGPLLDGIAGAGAEPVIVRCTVPVELARARALARIGERERVSDATPAVVSEQFRSFEELDEVPSARVLSLDTSASVDDQVADLARAIDRRRMHARAATSARGLAGEAIRV